MILFVTHGHYGRIWFFFIYFFFRTYNVNGLVNPIKRSKILTKLKRERVEVAFLQETHLSDTEHAKLKRLGFKHQYSSSYKGGAQEGGGSIDI